MHALFVTYRLARVTHVEHAERSVALAPAFVVVPGLVSKTWLENRAAGQFGAFYIFESRAAFDRFVASELFEMSYGQPHLVGLTMSDFAVDERPTDLTVGPLVKEGTTI